MTPHAVAARRVVFGRSPPVFPAGAPAVAKGTYKAPSMTGNQPPLLLLPIGVTCSRRRMRGSEPRSTSRPREG